MKLLKSLPMGGRHLLDLLVVIVGILVAFQLDTWNQDRGHRKLLTAHYEGLSAEMVANRAQLEQATRGVERQRALVDSILSMVGAQSEDVAAFNNYTFRLLRIDFPYIKRNAYQTLVTSGDVRLIKDYERKDQIISLYEFYDYVEIADKLHLESFQEYFFPYVMAHQDMHRGTPPDLSTYRDRAYSNTIATLRYHLTVRLSRYHKCLELLDDVAQSDWVTTPTDEAAPPPATKPATVE